MKKREEEGGPSKKSIKKTILGEGIERNPEGKPGMDLRCCRSVHERNMMDLINDREHGFCPLFNDSFNCKGNRCEWFIEEKDRCAIGVIAKFITENK